MNDELRKARILAKAAIQAETREELAARTVIRKRAELTAYLSKVKRAAEIRRKLARERISDFLAIDTAKQKLKKAQKKRGWYLVWEVEKCDHSPPCEPEESWWEARRKYKTMHRDNKPTIEAATIELESHYKERGNARIRRIGVVWAPGRK
jgi:hypothetical protein